MAFEMTEDATPPARLDQPCFFQHWERRFLSGTPNETHHEHRISSESSQPSPKSTATPQQVSKLRRNLAERSRSAPATSIPELAVPTIANLRTRSKSRTAPPANEDSLGQRDHNRRSEDASTQTRRSTLRAGRDSKKSSVSSLAYRFRNRLRSSLSDLRIRECRIPNSAKELDPPRKERPGYEWTKPGPKEDWVERLILTSGIMQRRAKTAEHPLAPIVPLRPPVNRTISGSVYEHTVNLETPFTKLRSQTSLDAEERSHKAPRPSIAERTRSVAKRVRFALRSKTSTSRICDVNQKGSPSTPLRGSLLSARNRTTEGLHRVASILHLLAADSPSRSTSNRSNQSREPTPVAQRQHPQRSHTFHLPTVIRNRSRKSTNGSYSSSIRKLRRGSTPANTPDPNETYRVKRSRSAETEEFFKIDISIRGGTSYLPSEARRIHTPPLPGDKVGQKRMGFFFDYTAPPTPRASDTEHRSNERHQGPSSPHIPMPPHLGRARTLGGADWFETQLAEVDAVDDDGGRNEARMALGLAREEREFVDMNVPEHLPSSPLCPRHWKHNSGGKGVCWMHGGNGDSGKGR